RLIADVSAHLLPRRRLVCAALLDKCASLIGDREQLAPLDLLGADQPLVLELRERRVYRAGARAPYALAALLHLLHDLVAVARLLGQQQQRGRADIPAARLAAWTEGPACGREAAEREAASPRPEAAFAMASAAPVGAAVGAAHRAPEPAEVIGICVSAASRRAFFICMCSHLALLS